MNKGKRLLFCKECNRKRYCTRVSKPGYYFEYVCSRGHKWVIKNGPAGQIIAAELERLAPNIKDLFERDDTFYKSFRK